MTITWTAKLPRFSFPLTTSTFRADTMAGLLGAVLSLPQGIAFGTLAGLPPEYGIYTAVVPCIVAALFGSSRHVVSGPTNANSLALFAALSPLAVPGSAQYIGYALAVTAIVGIMQFGVGAFKLGWITDFIAPAVLIGFMSGAALLIGLYAVPDMLGLTLQERTGAVNVVFELFHHVGATNMAALIVGLVTLVVTVGVAKISRRLPYMLIGIIGGYAASEALVHFTKLADVQRIGDIPTVVPPLSMPWLDPALLPQFVSIAGALSIVALGQSVSIAKALAQRSGQHIDVDREFVGQGLSNIAGSFFSSYVSCGSLMLFLPFQQAILIGSAISLLLYLNRTAHPAVRTLVPDPNAPKRTFTPTDELTGPHQECPQLKLVRIEGSIYFGAAGYVTRRLNAMREHTTQKHLLAMVRSMNFIDLAGAEVWEQELDVRRRMGGDLYFHRPRKDVRALWRRVGTDKLLGPDNVFSTKAEAISSILPRLDPDICDTCQFRIFKECQITNLEAFRD